jgi:hypothetical protein
MGASTLLEGGRYVDHSLGVDGACLFSAAQNLQRGGVIIVAVKDV